VTGDPAAPVEVVVDPPAPELPVATVVPAAPEEVALFALCEVEQLTSPAIHAPQSSSAGLARATPDLAPLDSTVRASRRTDKWSFMGVTNESSGARQSP
jgi:hypothetical protein